MPNYSNGKIYKIEPTCEHEENEVYIGATTRRLLSQRMALHRNDYKRWKKGNSTARTYSFKLFDKYGVENCEIILIEYVNCKTKDELFERERYHIKETPCINKCVPNRTYTEFRAYMKQYYQDHRIEAIEYMKQYRDLNSDILKVKRQNYYQKNRNEILLKKNTRERFLD